MLSEKLAEMKAALEREAAEDAAILRQQLVTEAADESNVFNLLS